MMEPQGPMADNPAGNPMFLLMALLIATVQLGIFVWLIVLAALDWRGFAAHWRRGLVMGVVLALAWLPVVVFEVLYFEPTSVPAAQQTFSTVVHLTMTIGQWVLGIGWILVLFCIAGYEWHRVRAGAMGWLTGARSMPWRSVVWGTLVGALYGAGSVAVFIWLGVGEGWIVQQMLANYPGMDEAPVVVLMGVGLAFASVAAVWEEVQFRGALLGFLVRVSGSHKLAIAASVGLVTVLFATLHLFNTDAPLVKFGQMVVFGVMVAEMARRWSLESAIACHLALNTVAILMAGFGSP